MTGTCIQGWTVFSVALLALEGLSPSVSGAAEFPAGCVDARRVVDQVRAQSIWNAESGVCMVSVDPFTTHDLVYRGFLFNEDGLMMVFNSFGDGPDSESTGARDFYLFPRRAGQVPPAFRPGQGNTLDVRLAGGRVMTFEGKDVSVRSLEDAEISVDPKVSPGNEGGVEIRILRGLLLDCGFRLGGQPESVASRTSVFRDPKGRSCKVENREIFAYQEGGDVRLRFRTDVALAEFLDWRCPDIDVTGLADRVGPEGLTR